jgi:CheY-like chemotaxis protein
LKQVLWNLLSNAIKFTPDGGRVVLLAHKLPASANPSRGPMLELTVADTGEGISPDFLPHVFERFRQADMGDTRAHAGLGIGLALTRQLVELHGGKIEVHSEGRGRGATFSVRLPWIDSSASAAAIAGEAGPDDGSVGPLVGKAVLVVEDDVNTREAMQCVLVGAGARVIAVSSGFEALRYFGMSGVGKGIAGSSSTTEPVPDLVVSDLGLPGMSGYELITRIAGVCRARGRRVPPACAVSAHAREVDRQRAIEAGFDLHMVKPITPEMLIEVVLDLADIAESQD